MRTLAIRPKRAIAGFVNVGGSITPTSSLLVEKLGTVLPPGTVLNNVSGGIAPEGAVAGSVSGPSLVTVPLSVVGSITPSGSVVNVALPTTIGISQEQMAGSITPVGSLSSVRSGPSIVTIPVTMSGNIVPNGAVATAVGAAGGTSTKSIAGTITPVGSVVNVVSGPSFVTLFKSIVGTITPSGSVATSTIAPPISTKEVTGVITPVGAISTQVSGPSFVTIQKSLSGGISPSGFVGATVGGPSLVTIPKSVSGSIQPAGAVASVKGGPSFQIIPKSVSGSITPVGSRSATVITGTPSTTLKMWPMLFNLSQSTPNLWNNNTPFWRGLIRAGQPTISTFIAELALIRSLGWRIWVGFAGPRGMWTDASGNFVFSMWKAEVDKFIPLTAQMQTYIDDGTLLHYIVDEPNIASFNNTIPPAVRKQMCQYSKSLWPNLKTGIRSSARFLVTTSQTSGQNGTPPGGWQGSLDFGWAQYGGPLHVPSANETPAQFYAREIQQFRAGGVPHIVLGNNWLNGGDGSSGVHGTDPAQTTRWLQTPTEIKKCYDAAVAILDEDLFAVWTWPYDQIGEPWLTYYNSASYQAAFVYGNNLLNSRVTSTPPPPDPPVYYTGTGVSNPPATPPNIAAGSSLRDALTNHKVFKLLDNGSVQSAEYSPMNADCSALYYFTSTGLARVADLVWTTSTVQLSGVRDAYVGGVPADALSAVWDRSDKKLFYFAALNAPAGFYKRDITTNSTTLIKDVSGDPSFVSFWNAHSAVASSLKVSGMHSSRAQEVLCALVSNATGVLGAVAWSRLTLKIWHFSNLTGKIAVRANVDDQGLFMKVNFSDGTWQVVTLNADQTTTVTSVLTDSDPPVRDDARPSEFWQASGLGLKRWTPPAQAAGTIIYNHPTKSSKSNPYSRAVNSMLSADELAYYSTYYGVSLAQSWVSVGGGVYSLDWTAEMAANANKLIPEVVRQGLVQLTKVTLAQSPLTSSCLDQSGPLTVLTGAQNSYDTRNSAVPNMRVDALAATWIGAGSFPINAGRTSAPGLCWHGGIIQTNLPDSTPWVNWHSTGGMLIYSPNFTLEDAKISKFGDGVRIEDNTDNWTVRRCYFADTHDDAIENDRLYNGLLEDCLIEGTYVFLSERPGSGVGVPVSGVGKLVTIKDCLVWHKPMPTTFTGPAPGTGPLFKWDNTGTWIGTRVDISNTIFRIDQFPSHGDLNFPPSLGTCTNVKIVWTGSGAYPGPVPPGVTVVTDINVWNNAVAAWKAAHP